MLTSIAQEHLVFSAFTGKGHTEDYLIQEAMSDPITFKSTTDPDTLYYHDAIAASDSDKFTDAIIMEVNTHCARDHWELFLRSKVPANQNILDCVWAMNRKRDIKT